MTIMFMSKCPPIDVREKILNKYCCYKELSNCYWELEDNCTFKDGINIDIIYRNIDEFAKSITMVNSGMRIFFWTNIDYNLT